MSIKIEEIPLEKLVATLCGPTWSSQPLHFVGDVGGTNARIGFGRKLPPQHAQGAQSKEAPPRVHIVYVHFSMTRKSIEQLPEFFATILETIRSTSKDGGSSILRRIVSGAVSVPGPVDEGGAVAGPFNNLHGVTQLSDYPKELFPTGHACLMNDLQAGGFGVAAVNDANVFDDYFSVVWEGSLAKKDKGRRKPVDVANGGCLVVAPGTGLGTSLIYPFDQLGRQSEAATGEKKQVGVMSLELGSTTLPMRKGLDPSYYMGLSEFVHGVSPTTHEVQLPISEDACCGRAILYNYRYLTQGEARAEELPQSAEQVVRLAKERKDPVAMKALSMAYQSLMATCGEGIITFLPRTVCVVGDNTVQNSFFFESEARLKELQAALNEHPMGETGFMSRPTFLRQTKPINLNLLGCCGFDTRPPNPLHEHLPSQL